MSDNYYIENWSKIILKFMRFANPHIAQSQAVSRLSLSYDPKTPIYFHAAWLKPGKNTYVIELDHFDHIDEEDGHVDSRSHFRPLFGAESFFGA